MTGPKLSTKSAARQTDTDSFLAKMLQPAGDATRTGFRSSRAVERMFASRLRVRLGRGCVKTQITRTSRKIDLLERAAFNYFRGGRVKESLIMVGARGFEPPAPCTPCRCATRLRHAPTTRNYTRR